MEVIILLVASDSCWSGIDAQSSATTFHKKGALETSEKFVLSRWERQRNNARNEVFFKGQTVIPQADYPTLLSVVFTDANRGWAVGRNGTIRKITVPNDVSLAAAKTIVQYSAALNSIANEYNVDLNLFKTSVEADQKEAADIARNLKKVNNSIERLKKNSKQSDEKESVEGDAEEERIDFMDPLRNLSPDASMTLNFTRVGVIGFIIYFIGILSNLYRYNLRLAAFYDSRADVLELKDPADTGFTELIGNFSPDHLNFGKPAQNPASQAVDLAKELLKARRF